MPPPRVRLRTLMIAAATRPIRLRDILVRPKPVRVRTIMVGIAVLAVALAARRMEQQGARYRAIAWSCAEAERGAEQDTRRWEAASPAEARAYRLAKLTRLPVVNTDPPAVLPSEILYRRATPEQVRQFDRLLDSPGRDVAEFRARMIERGKARAAHYAALRRKYERAARYPWIPVPPDPPPPE